MTQEEKDLVLRDLCARLPYGVMVQDDIGRTYKLNLGNAYLADLCYGNGCYIETPIKPYLRPMSSMTEDEKNELKEYLDAEEVDCNGFGYSEGGTLEDYISSMPYSICVGVVDWLNKKMFDYRGLIPKGLAEIAPEGMYEFYYLPSQNESDSVIDNTTKITVGCKIRSKTNPDVILSIISDDCHEDEFECSNGSVLSLKQIEKYYELIK